MKFKSSAIPNPSLGEDYSQVEDIVVPDQSMSLEEILVRFTRGEPLQVGFDAEFGSEEMDNPLNVDLEKLANSDLVDKEEFIRSLKELQGRYNKQEKEKADKLAAEKLAAFEKKDALRIKRAAKKLAEQSSGKIA